MVGMKSVGFWEAQRFLCMVKYIAVIFAVLVAIGISKPADAQHYAANVLYSDRPLPIFIGVDVGAGYTMWQHGTPTYFATNYPYSSVPDTIHVGFPDGATPLFGFFVGLSADFWLNNNWGIIAKLNYNERRGNWNATTNTQGDANGVLTDIPVTSDFTWMLRCASIEGYARYKFTNLSDFYVGAGLAVTAILSDHYDLTQTISGPAGYSFIQLGTGNGTGIQSYNIGGSLSSELVTMFAEFKLLAGFPFSIGTRWVLAPEVTLGLPLTSIWRPSAKADYQTNGIASPPSPVTITGLLTLRYQIQ